MQLTGKQIVESGIVIGACDAGVQQQGVDVRLMKVSRVGEGIWDIGYVPAKGKTDTPYSNEVEVTEDGTWRLEPGYYELEFKEGCKIPSNAAMYFKTRSSLVRCGAIVHSGQFDAGFETEKMGAFLHVILPIEIEVGARVAQMIVNESYEVGLAELYDGQWQNDKQRK